MANGAQAQKQVQKGQLNRVDLAPGDLDFCLTQPRILYNTATSFVAPDADHKQAYQSVLQRLGAGAGRLLVVGHTDDVGQPSDNDPLSERRARTVLAVLTGNVGDWESIFATERWGSNEFQAMLTEVGMPADAQSIRRSWAVQRPRPRSFLYLRHHWVAASSMFSREVIIVQAAERSSSSSTEVVPRQQTAGFTQLG